MSTSKKKLKITNNDKALIASRKKYISSIKKQDPSFIDDCESLKACEEIHDALFHAASVDILLSKIDELTNDPLSCGDFCHSPE